MRYDLMDKFINESEKELLIRKVYEQMQDEISRTIYKSRSLYSLSDDKNVLKNIVRESCISKILLQNVGKHKHQKLCLFGIGTWGKAILRYFDDIDWDYLVDNGKAGMEICGKPIVSIKQLETIEECYFVVSILFDYKSVVNQLIDIGIKKDNILILGQVAERLQYFDLPELKLGG
jgi:hypothetical protein